jgi:hypothetical protein
MVNPSQLAGMAQSAYSTGALTGLSIEPVRQAAKERIDYERKQQDSIYQITADLDAQAYNTLSNDVDQIFQDVADKKIYYDSPDMMGRLSALRGKAKAMSETDAILKAATDQFTKNPDGFVYNKKDANGNIVAGGYQDFVADLQARRNEKFEVPEEYMQSINGMLQNVGSRINEQQVVPRIQKSITDLADQYHKTIEAAKTEGRRLGKPIPAQIGRSIVQVTNATDISDFKDEIENAIIEGYSDDLGQLAALYRGRGGESLDDVSFAKKFVQDNLPTTRVSTEIRRDADPPTSNNNETQLITSNDGWSFGDFYGSFIRENIAPEGKEPVMVVNGISVEHKKTNPQQDLTVGEEEGARAMRGSVVRVFRDRDTGELMLKVRTGQNKVDIPYAPNYYVLEKEYGLTEDRINKLLSGRMGGSGEVIDKPANTTPTAAPRPAPRPQ